MAIARPFILRHIQLIQPAVLIMCGGAASMVLLEKSEGISRLRGTWHDCKGIKTRATYHPSYLLLTPNQKKSFWQDMLEIQAHMHEIS
jgi:DNA polymerase